MVALKQGRQAAGLASWGLGHDADTWWHLAACKATPDLHTAELRNGWHDRGSIQAHARHICLQHCPVLAQCAAETARNPPNGVVQAGLVWVTSGVVSGQPAAKQPAQMGCGLWCVDLPGTAS